MQNVIGLVVVGVLVFAVVFGRRPAPSITKAGAVPAETASAFHFLRGEGDVDYSIRLGPNSDTSRVYGYEGYVYTAPGTSATVTTDYYFIDPGLDLGAVCAARARYSGLAVRASPVRLVYGCLAPDVVAGEHWAGVGVSAYAPAAWVGEFGHALGVGAWYTYPYDSSGPGFALGLSLSIRN